MVTILEFRRPEGTSNETGTSQVENGERKSAEIIIFPGVRIERATTPPVPSQRQVRSPAQGSSAGTAVHD